MALSELFICRLALRQPQGRGYPFDVPLIRALGSVDITQRVTFFVGENGTGKSTLLEAVAAAYGLNPEGGSRNFHFSTRDTHSPLHAVLTVGRGPVQRPRDSFFLRAESFYNVASEIERLEEEEPGLLGAYGGESPHRQSHGESFLSLVEHRFRGSGLYILDEPEAALSPTRQMSLLVMINELAQAGSQFLIATHSPILMALPGAEILVIGSDGKLTPTRYEETEHVMVMRQFMGNPQGMLRRLLE